MGKAQNRGLGIHDGKVVDALGHPMNPVSVGDDLVARLIDAEIGYRPHVVGKLMAEAAARIIAVEAERDALHTALVMIAHTETENSFGGSQNMPSNWYRAQARAALTPEPS